MANPSIPDIPAADKPEMICRFLQSHAIPFERFNHPAVFTCEEAALHTRHLPGVPTKNLFLRDRNGQRHFLLSVPDHKQVDLKGLHAIWKTTKLSFGSPDRLQKYLGVEPGSVTILGLIHDRDHAVEVFVDRDLWTASHLQCHPLVNTASLVIPRSGLEKFFAATGHSFQIIDTPVRSDPVPAGAADGKA
jgi:Ala-tRNA(Pro) deacylase